MLRKSVCRSKNCTENKLKLFEIKKQESYIRTAFNIFWIEFLIRETSINDIFWVLTNSIAVISETWECQENQFVEAKNAQKMALVISDKILQSCIKTLSIFSE